MRITCREMGFPFASAVLMVTIEVFGFLPVPVPPLPPTKVPRDLSNTALFSFTAMKSFGAVLVASEC